MCNSIPARRTPAVVKKLGAHLQSFCVRRSPVVPSGSGRKGPNRLFGCYLPCQGPRNCMLRFYIDTEFHGFEAAILTSEKSPQRSLLCSFSFRSPSTLTLDFVPSSIQNIFSLSFFCFPPRMLFLPLQRQRQHLDPTHPAHAPSTTPVQPGTHSPRT